VTRARRSVTTLSAVSRELTILAVALVIGIIVVPLLIWAVGSRVLGPYTHGANTHAGPLALLGDFLSGLGHGWVSYWLVALGPALMIAFIRLVYGLLRPRPQEQPPQTNPVADPPRSPAGSRR
jgi:hypothetical protein